MMIASMILTAVLLNPPPPSGPIPWDIGIPAVPTTTAPTIQLAEMEHSESYEDRSEEIESQIESWSQPITELTETLGLWIGESGTLPDASEGDFSTGISILNEVGTAYDLAHWLGEPLQDMFSYIRFARTLPGTVFGVLLTAALVCASLILLIKLFTFALSIFDALYVFGRDVIALIGAYFPTGG